MTSPPRDVLTSLLAGFPATNQPQDANYQLREALSALAARGGRMECVAVRNDSVAPYGGYGFKHTDNTPDLANAFSVAIPSSGGVSLVGGFQQYFVSDPGVIATINVVRVAFGATLFGYFVENNPSHPRADQEGKPYCIRFGGSISQSFAVYDVASGMTFETTQNIATISFAIADANLAFRVSYPALYKSSRPVQFAFGTGFASERRTFPSPYLCIPHNNFAANAAFTMPQHSRAMSNEEVNFVSYAFIDAVFSGDGIPTTLGGSDPALPP